MILVAKSSGCRNLFIEFYLDRFESRVTNQERYAFKLASSFLLVLNIILIIKYTLNLFVEFNYETQFYWYDFTLFLGGIKHYNNMLMIFLLNLSLILNIKFNFSSNKQIQKWKSNFDCLRSSQHKYIGNNNTKLIEWTNLLYKLLNLSLITFGELLIW